MRTRAHEGLLDADVLESELPVEEPRLPAALHNHHRRAAVPMPLGDCRDQGRCVASDACVLGGEDPLEAQSSPSRQNTLGDV